MPAAVAVLLLAAAPAFAQDWFEPNPSLARLTADDAYARNSAKSLRSAGIAAAVAIRLDAAGRVVVAGGLRVARLDADGRLDPTFGVAGVAELRVQGNVSGLEIDAAGRIVVIGGFYRSTSDGPGTPPTRHTYLAARLLADGSLDPAYSGDGLLEFEAPGNLDLRAVRMAGSDGAMLAVVAKTPDPGSSYYPRVGLVRITADGALDATYGGGFAQIVRGTWVEDGPGFVADFAVDAAGRAVVVARRDSHGATFVLRLDAAGEPDAAFFGYASNSPGYVAWGFFDASRIALDGAGRIVGLGDAQFVRRLPDGAPDATFSGGSASRYEVAGFPGGSTVYAQLRAQDLTDPEFFVDGVEPFLAVATSADRWAVAKFVQTVDAKGDVATRGILVQSIDPADPGAIVSTTYRSRDPRFSRVAGLVVSPDGSTAYALGDTFVLRVDLAKRKALPLPDLRVKWLGRPRAVDLGDGRRRVTAYVRVTNASRRGVAGAYGYVGFTPGTYDVLLDGDPRTAGTTLSFRVRARSSVVKRFAWEGGDATTDLADVRLGIRVSCELPDANFADNTATSPPITPLSAPR